MGLDVTVSERVNFSTNKKGQRTWNLIELFNFHNCYKILDKLEDRLPDDFGNCSTYSFSEEQFFGVLHELEDDLEEIEKDNGKDYYHYEYESDEEYKERVNNHSKEEKAEISANISELKKFFAQENLQEQIPLQEDEAYRNDEQHCRIFDVHAWW